MSGHGNRTCPHCGADVRLRGLHLEGLFQEGTACPNCSAMLTVDPATRYRQAVCLILAAVSLALTMMAYLHGSAWLAASLVSYVVLAVMIHRGTRHAYLVPGAPSRHESNSG